MSTIAAQQGSSLLNAIVSALQTMYANKQQPMREESIRPMTTMEDWSMRAQEAYASKSPLKRMDVVPDIGPAAGMTRALKGKRVFHGTMKEQVYARHPTRTTQPLTTVENSTFKHFTPESAGAGAGGDLYGKGIYLTEHPKIAAGYAEGAVNHAGAFRTQELVRTQNLPPQAKILDIHAPMDEATAKKFLDTYGKNRIPQRSPNSPTTMREAVMEYKNKPSNKRGDYPPLGALIDYAQLSKKTALPEMVRIMGYDGIAYKAGQITGLPPGVSPGTKNYVIYNYDIINNPKSLLPKPAPKVNRGSRVGPMVQKEGSGEPYKRMPQSRQGEVSPTSVTPFELMQLGLSKGAPPYKMGSK